MNNLDENYQNLLQDILDNGVEKQTRNGKTLSVFGRTIRHNMSEGFPLLTSKKMAFKSIVVELLWFLKGRSDLRYLLEHNCYIWVGDAYKKYTTKERFSSDTTWKKPILLENGSYGCDIFSEEEFIEKIKTDDKFSDKWGNLGRIYGVQWREWIQCIPYDITDENCKVAVKVTDQIQGLIDNLKTNPDNRRLIVNTWNVSELDDMILPPCHYSFQVYTRELSVGERYDILNKIPSVRKRTINIGNSDPLEINKIPKRAISLMWNQRSVDTPLGLPFNIASYALLLKIIAKEVNMIPDELIGSLADTHIYENQIDGVKEQITRTSFDLPDIEFSEEFNAIMNDSTLTFSEKIEKFEPSMFKLKNYTSHSKIDLPLSN